MFLGAVFLNRICRSNGTYFCGCLNIPPNDQTFEKARPVSVTCTGWVEYLTGLCSRDGDLLSRGADYGALFTESGIMVFVSPSSSFLFFPVIFEISSSS
jgi:hypothetical protein